MVKVKVIFPDGSVREMPGFIQRDLLIPHVNQAQPEDHRDWDFEKISSGGNGLLAINDAEWAASPAKHDQGDQ